MTDIDGFKVNRRRGRPAKKSPVIESSMPVQAIMVSESDDELLTTTEAVALTKMSESWFKKQRWKRSGPPYRKRGRVVRYVKSELLRWFTEFRATDFGGAP